MDVKIFYVSNGSKKIIGVRCKEKYLTHQKTVRIF